MTETEPTASPPCAGTQARAGRGLDLGIAAVLALVTVGVCVATFDMGFVRDEAFYFADAEIYQDWQVRVERPASRKEALGRKSTLDTWRNNSEHPPLGKLAFGWSWRAFGRKWRPLERWREVGGRVHVDVTGLGIAHGFDEGARVELSGPREVPWPEGQRGRHLATGKVLKRTTWSAEVELEPGAQLAVLQKQCPLPTPAQRTGCEAVERRALYWLSESEAMRLPGALFTALLVAGIYLAGRLFFVGRAAARGPALLDRPFAAMAALGWLCLPQPFWHAHLATFDTLITALLFWTSVMWLRGLRSRAWAWATGVLWGVALLAKHNALFLPVPLAVVWLWDGLAEGRLRVHLPTDRRRLAWAAGIGLALALGLGWLHPLLGLGALLLALAVPDLRVELPAVPLPFFTMLLLGPVVLVAGWPLLWHDTADNLLRWIEFHLHHEHYMQSWFRQILAYPPFPPSYPWRMTLYTWPLTLLVAVAIGLAAVYLPRRWPWQPKAEPAPEDAASAAELRAWDRLLLATALWPMALISMPGTPIFGGTKHWMLAYAAMLLMAARGLQAVARTLVAPTRRWATAGLTALLVAATSVPAAIATADGHPHGSAWWNEFIGGIPGAADRWFMRQFWGGSTRDGIDEVNRRAGQGALVYFHDAAWGAVQMYQREGWLRRDLRYTADPNDDAQLGVILHGKDLDDYELDMMRTMKWRAPVLQSSLEGAPIVSVYERPQASRPQQPGRLEQPVRPEPPVPPELRGRPTVEERQR